VGLFLVGLRNIARNPRRSVLNATALSLGVAVMIIGLGWIRGYHTTIYGGVRNLETGDIEVLRDGYLDQERRLPLDLSIQDSASVAEKILRDPSVAAAAERIDFGATVGSAAGSVRVLGRGIDPAAESKVTTTSTFIAQGSFLSAGASGVLLGASLAAKLGIRVGEPVALSATDRYSVQNFIEIPVLGILRFGIPSLDDNLVFVDLATAQQLLSMPGSATRLVIRLRNGASEDGVLASLREMLRGTGTTAYPWQRFAEIIVSATSADIGGFWIILAVIFLLVVIGIVNSMSMTVHERIREIGTLRAIGMRRFQLAFVFLSEATTLALVAAAVGCILGGIFAFYMAAVGIDFSKTSLEMPIPFGRRFNGDYRALDFFLSSIGCMASALLGSLFPTRRAARLSISRALGTRIE